MSVDFPETRWSQLLALRDPAHPRRELLSALVRRYWEPVHCYVRALRRDVDAEELTQQFFTGLLERDVFAQLSPERGSLRGFLKTSVRNFLVSADRATAARPRLVGDHPLEISDPALPPDEAFDRAWARLVLDQAIERLREVLTKEDRGQSFALFEAYCLTDEDPPTYRALADRFGVSENDVRNRLREVRQRLRRIVRGLIREQLGPSESVDDELAFVLGKARG